MAQGHETPQPDPRFAETERRNFGDAEFLNANPQAQAQMAYNRLGLGLTSYLDDPSEERKIAAMVAAKKLSESIDHFAKEYPLYNRFFTGNGWMILEDSLIANNPR
ncbi:MAG: hypothetical protein ACHQT7_00950 [Candidatus Levyibacteriota bacterium]